MTYLSHEISSLWDVMAYYHFVGKNSMIPVREIHDYCARFVHDIVNLFTGVIDFFYARFFQKGYVTGVHHDPLYAPPPTPSPVTPFPSPQFIHELQIGTSLLIRYHLSSNPGFKRPKKGADFEYFLLIYL